MIYLDNAAAAPISKKSLAAMYGCMAAGYANPSAAHPAGQAAARLLEGAREKMASLLGCPRNGLYFCSGGTESVNWGLRAAAYRAAKDGKRHIIASAIEHASVLRCLESLAREGFGFSLAKPSPDGAADVREFERLIRPDTGAISLMYANNELGTVQPVSRVSRLCRERGVLFHTDAVQAAGKLPIDFTELGADYLSLSAHKFHGPKGMGALLCGGSPPLPLLTGGGQERGARAGTENLPGIAGMAAALEEAVQEMDGTRRRLLLLEDCFYAGISEIPGVILNSRRSERLPGLISVSVSGVDGSAVMALLWAAGVCVSNGAACSAGHSKPSHVLTAIGHSRGLSAATFRFSFSRETGFDEIRAACAAFKKACGCRENT